MKDLSKEIVNTSEKLLYYRTLNKDSQRRVLVIASRLRKIREKLEDVSIRLDDIKKDKHFSNGIDINTCISNFLYG